MIITPDPEKWLNDFCNSTDAFEVLECYVFHVDKPYLIWYDAFINTNWDLDKIEL